MAKSYISTGKDCAVVIAREDTDYSSSVTVHAFNSRPLTTDEIGQLAASFGLIYFKRTGKVAQQPDSGANTPAPRAKIYVVESAKAPPSLDQSCDGCIDGKCTGACLD